ncbi:centromere protein O [Pyxicephalus adspersus]
MTNTRPLISSISSPAGISGKLRDDGACFCISTAFRGTYLDSYYLQVNNVSRPQIVRHSIPAFIPLTDLAREHLPAHLNKLLHLLFAQLNGYAGRKFQANHLEKSSAYVAGSLQKNSMYTVLSFTYNLPVQDQIVSFTAKVFYGDIASTYPTEVTVTCPDDEASVQQMISRHVSLFSSTALHEALDSLTT